jgi:thiamine-monophosphate kinase
MPTEFDIIRQLAEGQRVSRKEIRLGIGDDAAVVDIPDGYELVISTDTINQGVHFPDDTTPSDIGYKSLAVNLSDLAAMGAEPFAVNLSLSLPDASATWLEEFADGFLSLASQYRVQLAGGDTTRGPLSISVTVMGLVPVNEAMRRSTAKPGDSVYVTGTLGDAGAALMGKLGELKLTGPQDRAFSGRFNRPKPRVEAGMAIRNIASSCIDISDGLVADLGHILEQSHAGATIYVDQLPLSDSFREVFDLAGGWTVPLASGDDYELCFTISDKDHPDWQNELASLDIPITCIGMIESQQGLRLLMPDGSVETPTHRGYEHFS